MTTLTDIRVLSARPGADASVWASMRAVVSRRDLIWPFFKRDLRNRTRATHLGWLWEVLNPLLMLAVYTLVFGSILRVRLSGREGEGAIDYAIYLFAGLTAFQLFAEPFARSAGLITSRRNFVKKMAFPLEIFAITSVLSALAHAGAAMALVMLSAVVLGHGLTWTAVLLPIVVLPAVLLAIACGWAFGALGVYVRDLQQVLGSTLSRLLFFLTPIIYSAEAVPGRFRWLLDLNPLTVVVTGVRRVVLDGTQPNWTVWGIWTFASCMLLLLSLGLFVRARRGFADVI